MDGFSAESRGTDACRAIGLLLRLKKRHPGRPDTEICDDEYNLFGYYDRLKIQAIHKWDELDPSNYVIPSELENKAASFDFADDLKNKFEAPEEDVQSESYFDEYPLKLLCPPCDFTDGVLDYSILESAVAAPFISVAMLHFTENTVASIRDDANPDVALAKLVQYAMMEAGASLWNDDAAERLKGLRCGLYYSLGFSDMVLVFLTKNLCDVSDFTFALRSQTISIGQSADAKKSHLISTAYVVAGINSKFSASENSDSPASVTEEDTRDLRLSIRFLLKTGVEPSGFYKRLRAGFGEKYKGIDDLSWFPEYDRLNAAGNTNAFSQMFGQSDLMFLFDVNPGRLLTEFLNDGLFNPKNEFYEKYVLNTRSSLRKIGGREFPTNAEYDASKPSAENDNMKRVNAMVRPCKAELRAYFQRRNDLMSKISMSKTYPKDGVRLYNGTSSILGLYMDLTSRSHAFDLRSLFDGVIKTFTYSLREGRTFLYKEYENYKKIDPPNDGNPEYQAWRYGIVDFIENTDKNIDTFRSVFNELILDFSRSDRLFIEGRTMLHVGVGSATKLIVAYARIINELTEAAKDSYEHHRAENSDDICNCSYAFLMSCGGTSVTEAMKFFSHIPPRYDADWPELSKRNDNLSDGRRISEHVLIRLKLPESTLFMPDLIMFFTMHEAFHYIGYRNPTLRVDKVAESIRRYISYYLIDAAMCDAYGQYLKLTDIKDTDPNEYIDLADRIRDDISEILRSRYVQTPPITDIYRHSQYLTYEFVHIFAEICMENEGSNPFSDEVNELCRLRFWEFWKKVLARYEGEESDSDIARIIQRIVRYYERFDEGVLIDGNNLLLFDALPNYTMIDDYMDDFDARLIELSDTREGRESLAKRNHTASLQFIADAYINAYKEAFADGVACLYAGCETGADYLYAFFRSIENPQDAFTPQPENVLRFGSVLVTIDQEAMELMDCDLDAFDERLPGLLKKYEKELDGYAPGEEAAVSAYIKSFGALLTEYRYFYRRYLIARPLEEYVRACRADHAILANDPNNAVVSDVRRLFKWKKGKGSYDGVWRVLTKYWARTASNNDAPTVRTGEGFTHER